MDAFDGASRWLAAARVAMEIEAQAISTAAERLNGSLCEAVGLILGQHGKVVLTGIGKSGHIAGKIVATLCSTGTPAVFLHPTEAAHGDLGVCSLGDTVLMVSKSGATSELVQLVPGVRELGLPIIGILGNLVSPLAGQLDIVLDASVGREADPANLAPTASAAVALALGDALAVALMEARNFTAEDFRQYHPGGWLGANLRRKAKDAIHRDSEVAWASPEDSLKQVVIAMTRRPLGAACVVSAGGQLAGVITDGDLRRALEAYDDIRLLRAADIMTARPVTINPEARLLDALRLMEDRPSQISVLPVVEPADGRCLGLLRLHDLYRATTP